MITFGRRGGALLLGIATGGLLVGGVAVAAPATVGITSWQTLLAAEETDPSPPSTSSNPPTTRPPWRTAAPVAAALPTAAAVPADPALAILNPPVPEAPPAPPAPEAVPVRALVDDGEDDESEDDGEEAASGEGSGSSGSVIALTNEERREAGCGDLAPDARLTSAAQQHASDMAANGYFDHDSEDGTRFDTRIRAAGHPRPGGENIAMGQSSAEQVVQEWMDSPPHRRNIENCAFRTIGVGHDDSYWVQDFGR